MKIHECRVQHTYTHDGVEEAQRHVSVQVTASLELLDKWRDLADYIHGVLIMGALEPREETPDVRDLPPKTTITEAEAAVGLEALFGGPEVFKCPHCSWTTTKGLPGVSCHIGKKHKEA